MTTKSTDTQSAGYFLGFAQVWCQNQTDQAARQSALTDPPLRRVGWRLTFVQNFEEFGKAFGCKKGQPMYPVTLPGLVTCFALRVDSTKWNEFIENEPGRNCGLEF